VRHVVPAVFQVRARDPAPARLAALLCLSDRATPPRSRRRRKACPAKPASDAPRVARRPAELFQRRSGGGARRRGQARLTQLLAVPTRPLQAAGRTQSLFGPGDLPMQGFTAGTEGVEVDGDMTDVVTGGNRDLFGINNDFDTVASH
jgi:hypothetical protein